MSPSSTIKPRIIIHGGAGNITPHNLPPPLWSQYHASLQRILHATLPLLPTSSALEAAVHAVQLLEADPLFNAGVGAVFNSAGRVELEASVMVSSGHRKRGVGVMMLKHVKSPISLAAAALRHGDEDEGGGMQGHQQLAGEAAEDLARRWGLDMVDESYFWTRKRWQEHKKGSEWEDPGKGKGEAPGGHVWSVDEPSWNGVDYLPQGTVGCVVLDRFGTVAVANEYWRHHEQATGKDRGYADFGSGFLG